MSLPPVMLHPCPRPHHTAKRAVLHVLSAITGVVCGLASTAAVFVYLATITPQTLPTVVSLIVLTIVAPLVILTCRADDEPDYDTTYCWALTLTSVVGALGVVVTLLAT